MRARTTAAILAEEWGYARDLLIETELYEAKEEIYRLQRHCEEQDQVIRNKDESLRVLTAENQKMALRVENAEAYEKISAL